MQGKKRSTNQSSKKVKTDTSSQKETPTEQEPKTTSTGKQDTTKPTSSNLSGLEAEAKEFRDRKRPRLKPKPMNARVYYIGQAMCGLLARSNGLVSLRDLKRESEEIADYFMWDE